MSAMKTNIPQSLRLVDRRFANSRVSASAEPALLIGWGAEGMALGSWGPASNTSARFYSEGGSRCAARNRRVRRAVSALHQSSALSRAGSSAATSSAVLRYRGGGTRINLPGLAAQKARRRSAEGREWQDVRLDLHAQPYGGIRE